jgi:thiol-disulfide isomerase/thioredoxin
VRAAGRLFTATSGYAPGVPVPLILAVAALVIGDPLPPLAVTTTTGAAATLPATGRVRVIDFFATWCGPCRDSLPALERLRRRFGDRVEFISIDEGDDGAQAAAFLRSLGVGTQLYLDRDGSAFRRLGAHRLPTTYVVDGRGVVRRINHGSGPGYEARMAGWLAEIAGQPR